MKLENQVVSLDLAKRLKELGVKQESLFWWCEIGQQMAFQETEWEQRPQLRYVKKSLSKYEEMRNPVSAFTVAELGEMLPVSIGDNQLLEIFKRTNDWEIYYDMYFERADTEANARAKMLIYLLENKFILV